MNYVGVGSVVYVIMVILILIYQTVIKHKSLDYANIYIGLSILVLIALIEISS